MKISIVVAVDEKRGIGKGGKLPWNIPEDLKHFKEITLGHTIIMGRKTFDSIGRILPSRTNIIITRDPSFTIQGAMIVRSLEEAIEKAENSKTVKQLNGKTVVGKPVEEIFIIGGGQVFTEAMSKNLVDKIYLTIVDPPVGETSFNCDTFFPDYSNFRVVKEESFRESNETKYKFVELQK